MKAMTVYFGKLSLPKGVKKHEVTALKEKADKFFAVKKANELDHMNRRKKITKNLCITR